MPVLDQRLHESEQQCQQQRGDVLAVDVGVGHQHDLVIAQLREVELVVDTGAERGDDRLDFGVLQHPVDARLLDVDDLAAQRQDRLEHRVAAALRRAAGRITLHHIHLRQTRDRWSGSRRACRAARRCRWRSCGAPAHGPCARPVGPAPTKPPCSQRSWLRPGWPRTSGCSCSLQIFCTNDLTSVLPSLVLV